MKLSLITINLNNERGLLKTIESVVNQSYNDFEYVVIDGASTDKSVDVIKKYQDKISYWVSEPDTGIYNAMNKGINIASGEYLLFLNSGDILASKDVLEGVYGRLGTVDIIYGYVEGIEKNGEKRQKILPPEEITFRFFYSRNIPHQAEFISKKLFEKLGLYNENHKILSDYEFNLKALMSNASFCYIEKLISIVDLNGISSSSQSIEQLDKERKMIFSQNIPNGIFEDYLFFMNLTKQTKEQAKLRVFCKVKKKLRKIFEK